MKTLTINSSLREQLGKKESKRLRKEGNIPCVFYGKDLNLSINVSEKELSKLVYTPDVYSVKLNIEDKEYNAIMKDLQFHPVTDKILHVDFFQLSDTKAVAIEIPVQIVGNAIGVKSGGRLVQLLRKVKLKALPVDIPDYITINVDDLNIGQSIKVKDLQYKDIQFLNIPNAVIVAAKTARAVIEETPEVKPVVASVEAAKTDTEVSTSASKGSNKS